jgi:hypothetical protein
VFGKSRFVSGSQLFLKYLKYPVNVSLLSRFNFLASLQLKCWIQRFLCSKFYRNSNKNKLFRGEKLEPAVCWENCTATTNFFCVIQEMDLLDWWASRRFTNFFVVSPKNYKLSHFRWPPLWSSDQSSWLQNGDILWFLWCTNWIYICYVEESRPPLMVRVPGYRSRAPGFNSQRYKIFWRVVGLEQSPLSLVSTIEELLGRKSSGSSLESREYGRRDSSRWPLDSFYPQKLALTSPTSGGRSVVIIRARTCATEFVCLFVW